MKYQSIDFQALHKILNLELVRQSLELPQAQQMEEPGHGGVLKEPLTAASTIYHAVGILETEQETIIFN